LIGRSPVQALANEPSPIPAQYFGFIGLSGAFGQLDLLSAPLFGNLAKFGRDTVRINKLFSKAGTRPQSNNQQHTAVKRQSDRQSSHHIYRVRRPQYIIARAGLQYWHGALREQITKLRQDDTGDAFAEYLGARSHMQFGGQG